MLRVLTKFLKSVAFSAMYLVALFSVPLVANLPYRSWEHFYGSVNALVPMFLVFLLIFTVVGWIMLLMGLGQRRGYD